MRQRQRGVWRRAVFALLLGVWLALLPQAASAEKTDWKDSSYDFSRVKRVLVYDVDLSVPDFSSNLKAHKYQSDFPQYAKKMGCEILTEEQARRRISLAIGVDLDGLANTDPARANQLFAENLSAVADAWVKSRVLKWENGNWVNDYYYVTVPVTYPPRRVDVSTLNMSFEVYDAKTGKMIFGREDDRDREDYDAQDGMYERICKSFFSDFGNKIH